MLADMLSFRKLSMHTILNENLGLKKLCAKIVPKLLTQDQKLRRVLALTGKLTQTPNFLERKLVKTSDEYWLNALVREFLGQNLITTLYNSPYSPDLTSCDFFNSKIKNVNEGAALERQRHHKI